MIILSVFLNNTGGINLRKKLLKLGITVFIMLFLASCSNVKLNKVNPSENIVVEYEGLDTIGKVSYWVDVNAIVMEVVGAKDEDELTEKLNKIYEKDEETYSILVNLTSFFEITADKGEELKNGDKINLTVKVDPVAKDFLETGTKEFIVEGLEEPKKITSDEVKKHIVTYFIGADGRGYAVKENTFNNDLIDLDFTVKNNGKLSNGDKVALTLSEESVRPIDLGYKLEDEFLVELEVKGLIKFAESPEDIKNFKDIKRMIEERANELFQDSILSKYELKQEVLLYRQFDTSEEANIPVTYMFSDRAEIEIDTNGSLVALYKVKEYDSLKQESKGEYIVDIGYENLVIDKEGKVNVADMIPIGDKYIREKNKSIETLTQLYEGNGYTVVK